ncbi:MAG: DUF3987 domain-containing protein [Pararhodobacter sp.]
MLGPRLAGWVADAAEAKGASADYVFAALLAVAGATIGNARWAAIWQGWAEPPVIWAMCIGLPSAGKSPAIDAALQPLRKAERPLREAAEAQRKAWAEKAELAKLAESTWKEAARAAIKDGKTPPDRPASCDAGPPPHIPRLVVNDGTIERLGAILDRQPRGTLQMRDELAGWLEGMQRYSGGGSDRPFWLEAFGGRGFTVERMGREPLTIDRLSIGVLGGIQPDRLKSLLFKSDDDGLLARFLPIWPEAACNAAALQAQKMVKAASHLPAAQQPQLAGECISQSRGSSSRFSTCRGPKRPIGLWSDFSGVGTQAQRRKLPRPV